MRLAIALIASVWLLYVAAFAGLLYPDTALVHVARFMFALH